MLDLNQGRFQQQVSFLKRQILREGELPFTYVLSEKMNALTTVTTMRSWNRASVH